MIVDGFRPVNADIEASILINDRVIENRDSKQDCQQPHRSVHGNSLREQPSPEGASDHRRGEQHPRPVGPQADAAPRI